MYYNVLQSSTITITFFGVSVARLHKLLLYVCLFPAIIRYVYSNGVFYLYLNVTRVVCDDVAYDIRRYQNGDGPSWTLIRSTPKTAQPVI